MAKACLTDRKFGIVFACWIFLVTLGLVWLWGYASRPAAPASAPERWPQASGLTLSSSLPTVIMFGHPHCTCTRASLNEYSRLMSDVGGKLSGYFVLIQPDGMPDDWAETDLLERAQTIPGVSVLVDQGRAEADRFGAVASGHVVVYNPAGELLFSGGITPSRAHEGDSFGRQRILAAVAGLHPDRPPTAPTFGCELHETDAAHEVGFFDVSFR